MNKRICIAHVSELHLKSLIAQSSEHLDACDYCGDIGPTIAIEKLAQHLDDFIEAYYEPTTAGDEEPVDGSEPDGEPLAELLEREIGLVDEPSRDAIEWLLDLWFDRDALEHVYGEDPHFVPRAVFADRLSKSWDDMERSLKSEARLVNPKAYQVLERVFGPVIHDRAIDGNDVIFEAGPGTSLERLFRARVFQTESALAEALRYPERNFGPPPEGLGRQGRMNAQGISVFYGSTDREIAVAEVRPPVGSELVVACFKIVRKLRLLDIERLGEMDVIDGSRFDPATLARLERRDFLRMLTRRLVMPVMPELEDQSYLITQAIADYLATHPGLNLDGILFHSAQIRMGQAPPGRNVVLFKKASRVSRSIYEGSQASDVNLWDFDEDGGTFNPCLFSVDQERPAQWIPEHLEHLLGQGSAIELDRYALEIVHIRGISYATETTGVSHIIQHAHRPPPMSRN